jgi:hypothetical protein
MMTTTKNNSSNKQTTTQPVRDGHTKQVGVSHAKAGGGDGHCRDGVRKVEGLLEDLQGRLHGILLGWDVVQRALDFPTNKQKQNLYRPK